jgi:histidyl-tRNA synthetase
MQQTGLKKYVFKVGHIGVLRGILSQEKVDEKTQNTFLQLMDKKQFDDALALLAKSGTPPECTSIIQKLVELKGDSILDVAEKTKTLVNDYEQSLKAMENLKEILELVSGSGCKIDVTVEAGFARGLEYYTGMIFEIYVPDLGIALGGGGRYNRLIELFGGEPTPAVGVAHGIDRIMLGLHTQSNAEKSEEPVAVMVMSTKDELVTQALRIAQLLRVAGIPAELEIMRRKMVKTLEVADKKKTTFAVIVGEKELGEGAVVIRNLSKREQNTISIERMAEYLKCHD